MRYIPVQGQTEQDAGNRVTKTQKTFGRILDLIRKASLSTNTGLISRREALKSRKTIFSLNEVLTTLDAR